MTKLRHTAPPRIAVLLLVASACLAQSDSVLLSLRAPKGAALNLDPKAALWREAPVIVVDKDKYGRPVGRRTEVRSRWTEDSLLLLFVSSYEKLHLKPNPDTKTETNELWNWDVAEAFLGSDFANIKRYKEFEVSPQGEWVDLDIDRDRARPEDGWTWNSGFRSAAKIDRERKVWIAAMEIPWKTIAAQPPAPGLELRANFYRTEGAPPGTLGMAWRPTNKKTFHAPEAFGTLRLADSTTTPKR